MSNILDMLLGGNNNVALKELGKQFNLDDTQTRTAVEELIPALSRGLQKNSSSEMGMDDLLDALKTGEHTKYMDQPTNLGKPETAKDGNDILGHIFGKKKSAVKWLIRFLKNLVLAARYLKRCCR